MALLKPLHSAAALGGAAGALALCLGIHSAHGQSIKFEDDRSWVRLTGIAVEQAENHFVLDYGGGTIVVETDDRDKFSKKNIDFEGDRVTVHGKVDDDFYHEQRIEADTVFVSNLNTLISDPSPKDREGAQEGVPTGYVDLPVDTEFYVAGTVTSVSERVFTLDTGARKIKVDTREMPYNPMDDKGRQQIQVGDKVSVSGDLGDRLFKERQVNAQAIVSLE